MITILICSLILSANALEKQYDAEDEIKAVLNKYIEKVPDIEEKYVVNEGLSKSISKYFGGKISALPLFKISLKIDREPIKIPWTVGDPTNQLPASDQENKGQSDAIQYKFLHPKMRAGNLRH